MDHDSVTDRRDFLRLAAAAGASVALAGCSTGLARSDQPAQPPAQPATIEVTPTEDLMREHGLLVRILIIYDEIVRRIDGALDAPPDALPAAAAIVRRFIEDYHEKLEEDQLFPRFQRHGRRVGLVRILRDQHLAGRRLTARILELGRDGLPRLIADRRQLSDSLKAFRRMYLPHLAREETVLFPDFHNVVTPAEYDELGDRFEDKEHELFGADGFFGIVRDVAAIESKLGLADLAAFTPNP